MIKFFRPILQLLQLLAYGVTASMTKMDSTKRSSKGSSRNPVPHETDGIQSCCSAQEPILACLNISWFSRVSRQDYPYSHSESFQYMHQPHVALSSLSPDMSPSNLRPKDFCPDAERYEE